MPPNERERRPRRPVMAALGLLAIAGGLLCNELVYTFFFTLGVWTRPRTQLLIWLLDLGLVVCGVLLVARSRVDAARAVGMIVVGSAALVMLVEGVFATLPTSGAPAATEEGDFFAIHQPDARRGSRPLPNGHARHVRMSGDQTVYDVEYTIDDRGRRVTPQSQAADRDRFLLFFGCSFTFGQGLAGDDTLPSHAAAEAPRHRAYNYGFVGYGPNHVLAQLQRDDLRSEIAEPSGIAFYTFIDHHVERANGRSDALWSWLWDGPYFTVDDAGRLTHPGGFRRARPGLSFLSYVVARSHTARYFNRSFPPMTDASLDLTVRIIVAARDTYAGTLGNDAFYVVVYPHSWRAPEIVPRLERAGVRVLDYSRLFDGRADGDDLFIAHDGHPTGTAHRVVAQRLVADLGIAASAP